LLIGQNVDDSHKTNKLEARDFGALFFQFQFQFERFNSVDWVGDDWFLWVHRPGRWLSIREHQIGGALMIDFIHGFSHRFLLDALLS